MTMPPSPTSDPSILGAARADVCAIRAAHRAALMSPGSRAFRAKDRARTTKSEGVLHPAKWFDHCRRLGRGEMLMLRFLRSLLAGGVATFVDLAALSLLVSVVGLAPREANLPALLAGAAVQFFANRHFVFRAREGSIAKQALLFVVVEAAALLLNG